jgi:hypothetical protein
MDLGRNLHVTYAVSGSVSGTTSTFQVFTTVAAAASNWSTWAKPVKVSLSPSNVNVFPWMVAGGPGRSDSVWYGTSSFVDPSTNGGQAWNVYMSQVVWPLLSDNKTVDVAAANASQPIPNMVKVSPHPAHYNSICLLGTGCITAQGDRNLADFFTVTMDHNGAADVEYDDTSNGLLQPGFVPASGLADHPGAPVVTIAHQDSGPGLLVGTTVTGLANEPTSAPTTGMIDPFGDAKYPVIGGTNQPAFDLLGNQLALSANNATLTVTMNVADLSPTTMLTNMGPNGVAGATLLQYVTRWQMGNTIYYAMMETNAVLRQANQDQFFAGAVQSIDLCSVSACDPHVTVYPDQPAFNASAVQTGGFTVAGSVNTTTNTISIQIPATELGSPNQSSLLEEVGTYSFGSARQQSAVVNTQAEADQLPLEIDGICCFNFGGSQGGTIPEVPWTPAFIGIGAVLIAAGVAGGRRRRRQSMSTWVVR